MEWTCPHCKTELAADANGESTRAFRGLRPGWRYVRCFSCGGLASLEIKTGQAIKIGQVAAPVPVVKAVPTPPPFVAQGSLIPPPFDESKVILATAPEPDFHEMLISPMDGPAPQIVETPVRRRFRPSPLTAGILTVIGIMGSSLWIGRSLLNNIETARMTHTAEAEQARKVDSSKRAAVAAARLNAQGASPAPVATTSDTIRSAAAAPAPMRKLVRRTIPSEEMQLFVHAREGVHQLELRSGPGDQYVVTGTGRIEYEYPVIEWQGRWFKIGLDEEAKKTAWVHYDRIELFSNEGNP